MDNTPSSNSNTDTSDVTKSVAIMFSDVAGSTSIYDSLGDAAAEKCIGDCVSMMKRVVKTSSGEVVKTIGDEVMARFSNANDAFDAANKIQKQSANIMRDELNSVQVRIGMHAGPVIEKDNDIFGDAVNIAARMTGVAKAGQIIISGDLFHQLDDAKQSNTRLYDRARVKGKEQKLDIYQVVEEDQYHTSIITAHDGGTVSSTQGGLVLVYNANGHFVANNENAKAFTIGRDAACDLMVNSDYASRSHIEISWKRDKFLLTDHSTNGTTVTSESGESIFLRRESYPLVGKGSFMLGVDGKHIITFHALSEQTPE